MKTELGLSLGLLAPCLPRDASSGCCRSHGEHARGPLGSRGPLPAPVLLAAWVGDHRFERNPLGGAQGKENCKCSAGRSRESGKEAEPGGRWSLQAKATAVSSGAPAQPRGCHSCRSLRLCSPPWRSLTSRNTRPLPSLSRPASLILWIFLAHQDCQNRDLSP